MIIVRDKILIAGPASEVWPYIADPQRMMLWNFEDEEGDPWFVGTPGRVPGSGIA